jgi:hypothetical protein
MDWLGVRASNFARAEKLPRLDTRRVEFTDRTREPRTAPTHPGERI